MLGNREDQCTKVSAKGWIQTAKKMWIWKLKCANIRAFLSQTYVRLKLLKLLKLNSIILMRRKMGKSLGSMHLGLLSPQSGRRQLVKVGGRPIQESGGGGQDGYFWRNNIWIWDTKLAIGVREGSGVASNGEAQGWKLRGTLGAEFKKDERLIGALALRKWQNFWLWQKKIGGFRVSHPKIGVTIAAP